MRKLTSEQSDIIREIILLENEIDDITKRIAALEQNRNSLRARLVGLQDAGKFLDPGQTEMYIHLSNQEVAKLCRYGSSFSLYVIPTTAITQ